MEEQREENDDVLTVRKSTRTGRPAGDHDFERRIEGLTGRVLQRKKPGPKKAKTLN